MADMKNNAGECGVLHVAVMEVIFLAIDFNRMK